MTFEIKKPTPRTDYAKFTVGPEHLGVIVVDVPFARKLERELIACGHEQLTCCNCGAVRNDTKDLTEHWEYCSRPEYLQEGTFQCPLCGHENHWRRISRFVTT